MNKINISLENCYGINFFTEELDFSKGRVIAIYAPNATMKTSFAKTFLDLSNGNLPIDKLRGKEPVCSVMVDESSIEKEEIFVIESMNDTFESKKLSSLLVDLESMGRYNELNAEILSKKKELINSLNKVSGIKKDDIENTLIKDFKHPTFFDCLINLNFDNKFNDFSYIKYKDIFNQKVVDLLNEKDVIDNITDYSIKYNQLIEESSYFKKGVFSPFKAQNVVKSTKDENFFDANHGIILAGNDETIHTAEEFEKIIEDEKNKILTDAKLQNIEQKISNSVKAVKEFQDLLEVYPELITYLTEEKYESLREILWKSYLKNIKDDVDSVLLLFNENKEEIQAIEATAAEQTTEWEVVVEEFESRFYVPFKIFIENKQSMVLGNLTPTIKFDFGDDVKIDKNSLNDIDTLSQGEKRALYLLNIIFEVRARQKENQKTLFIVDDIVDSFDYKNKYAIIEYLKDISEIEYFYQIILTHNFDFFRTIQGRVMDKSKWHNSFMAEKSNTAILLLNAGANKTSNPFEIWKKHFHTNDIILIALIPFIRNLAEYTGNTVIFNKLTNLLHIKNETETISISDLEVLIKGVLHDKQTFTLSNPMKSVYILIIEKADEIQTAPIIEEIELEKKIVLSIAIRLIAEKYMITKINNPDTVANIGKPQTGKLFNKIKEDTLCTPENLAVLELVNIITPENIHLNSFMFEPILDMSRLHLVELYSKVKALA